MSVGGAIKTATQLRADLVARVSAPAVQQAIDETAERAAAEVTRHFSNKIARMGAIYSQKDGSEVIYIESKEYFPPGMTVDLGSALASRIDGAVAARLHLLGFTDVVIKHHSGCDIDGNDTNITWITLKDQEFEKELAQRKDWLAQVPTFGQIPYRF